MLQLKFGNCHFIIAKKEITCLTPKKKKVITMCCTKERLFGSLLVSGMIDGTKVLLASHILIEHSVVIRRVASWVSNERLTASISLHRNNSIRHFLSYTLPDTAYSSWFLWNCVFPWCLQFLYAFHEIKAGENTKQRWITSKKADTLHHLSSISQCVLGGMRSRKFLKNSSATGRW